MLLAVNFHYIQETPRYPYQGIYPTKPDQLAAQLREIGRFFEFISGEQLCQVVQEAKPIPERACIITFDDGLRSQYENALPVLDRLGVPAIFFVSAQPLIEDHALTVHKIHYIRANVAPDDLMAEMHRFLGDRGVSAGEIDAGREQAVATYRYDEPESALLKWYLNFGLERVEADRFVSPIFAKQVGNEAAWCERTYMRPEHVCDLARRGFLGNHSFEHLPLAMLEVGAMRDQLQRNQVELEKMGGVSVPYISFPYGGANAVDEREAVACADIGIKIGFTMERSLNSSLRQPLLFARIDTNDALGGRRPLMAPRNGTFTLKGGLTPARRRYFTERDD